MDLQKKPDDLSPMQKAAVALRNAELRIQALERAVSEPIAIVGMACRFPGAPSVLAYSDLLEQGVDAVSETPKDRWDLDKIFDPNPSAPGKINTRFGGFIDDVERFDAAFFGISPLEARLMDPQQRLGLEIVWHALEDSGLRPSSLRGSNTGVFVGITQNDYGMEQLSGPPEDIRAYSGTGNGFCFAAGRIAYQFGFNGPVTAVDTACSSSLVALNQACSALRSRECDLAVVVGMQLNLTPPMQIFLSRTQSFSPSGRCRVFDAASDGFILGEGIGAVVLKRASDQTLSVCEPRAIMLNCGVNHDGPASGLTVPNESAQEKLLASVLKRSKCNPDDVAYIETHGTATPLGDPIEISALRTVFGARPKDKPLFIGSVKANIGHLSAAAGMASLIKAVLMIERDTIFPQIHFDEPNPKIPWGDFNVKVSSKKLPLHRGDDAALVGVSSFGLSGTNAHALLRRPLLSKNQEDTGRQENQPFLLALSAANRDSYAELIKAHYSEISTMRDDETFMHYCRENNLSRDTFTIRHLLIAESREEASSRLRKLIDEVREIEINTPKLPGHIAFSLTGPAHLSDPFYKGFDSYRAACGSKNSRPEETRLGSDPQECAGTHSPETALVALADFLQSLGVQPDFCLVDKLSRSAGLAIIDPATRTSVTEFYAGPATDHLIDTGLIDEHGVNDRLVQHRVDTILHLTEDDNRHDAPPGVRMGPLFQKENSWDWLSGTLKVIYESGRKIEWQKLYSGNRARITLPLYPFSKKRFWMERRANSGDTIVRKGESEVDSNLNPRGFADTADVFSTQWDELRKQTLSVANAQFKRWAAELDRTNLAPEVLSSHGLAEFGLGDWRLTVFIAPSAERLQEQVGAAQGNLFESIPLDFFTKQAKGLQPSLPAGFIHVKKSGTSVTSESENLKNTSVKRLLNVHSARSLTMVFAGVGDQYRNMGAQLYKAHDVFRHAFDHCAHCLKETLGCDIREVLFKDETMENREAMPEINLRAMLGRENMSNSSTRSEDLVDGLESTVIVQPLVFAFDYSLAKMWMEMGVMPDYLIGYSVGEYAAACIAGVFSVEDAAMVVARRAQLISELPEGGLMAIPLGVKDCEEFLGEDVFVGIASSEKQTILSGTRDALDEVGDRLKTRGTVARLLPGSHAYHSPLLQPICKPLESILGSMEIREASIPLVSNVTGKPMTKEEAADPAYWSKHSCSTVRFADGLGYLLGRGDLDFLELGPGRSLGSFVMQHSSFNREASHTVVSSVPGKWEKCPDERLALESFGILQLLGHKRAD